MNSLKRGFAGRRFCEVERKESWFERFAKVMKNMGYKQSQGDHTLFIKHADLGRVITFLVYIDDIIMTGFDEKERPTLRQCLTNEFEIKSWEG